MNRRKLDDTETAGDSRELQDDVVTNTLADECTADGRTHADLPFLELDRITEDEAVVLARLGLLIFNDNA
jgi:hypothetical protein